LKAEEAAARAFFVKPCSDLTEPEAAALAAAIINPRRHSPIHPNKRIRNRIVLIQGRMQKYRYYKQPADCSRFSEQCSRFKG